MHILNKDIVYQYKNIFMRNKPSDSLTGINPRPERNIAPWCDGSLDQSFIVDALSYFSFQPVLHDWCNKDCDVILSMG